MSERCIKLPEDLCARAEQKFAGKFSNLEQMLEFILSELLRDDGMLDQQEQRLIEQRLKDLGYL